MGRGRSPGRILECNPKRSGRLLIRAARLSVSGDLARRNFRFSRAFVELAGEEEEQGKQRQTRKSSESFHEHKLAGRRNAS